VLLLRKSLFYSLCSDVFFFYSVRVFVRNVFARVACVNYLRINLCMPTCHDMCAYVWRATAPLGVCQKHLPCLVVVLFWHMLSGAAVTETICLLHVLCVSVVLFCRMRWCDAAPPSILKSMPQAPVRESVLLFCMIAAPHMRSRRFVLSYVFRWCSHSNIKQAATILALGVP
jgi:hypothetical protein